MVTTDIVSRNSITPDILSFMLNQRSMPSWNPFQRKPESTGQIKPTETEPAAERREQVSKLVEVLRTQGWVEMKAPQNDPSIRLFAVCRSARNPDCPSGTIDIRHHATLGGFTYGFTEAYIIDLVAEFPKGSGVFIPVGHRDIKIARFNQPDKPVLANGNFKIKRRLFKEWQVNTPPQALDPVLQVADHIYGMNGVAVISEATPTGEKSDSEDIDRDVLARYYEQHKIPLTTSWQGRGLGKLLIGLELELLRQRGVHELKLENLSDDLERIFKKLPIQDEKLHIQSLPSDAYQTLIAPFLPDQACLPTSARPSSTRTPTIKRVA